MNITETPEYRKFVQCIEAHSLFTPQTPVVAAVSGGADSVCMLLLLRAYLPAERITVAHFHHGIRGTEADRDAAFVKKLAETLQVECCIENADVPALAKASGCGIEETAREYRYAFLSRIAKMRGAVIAVAHNSSDRAETVLMNLARGTSPEGLKGISYKRWILVRPVLDFTREETENVCRTAGITPMTDSTNLTDCTLRNRVRHEILPYLSEQFGHDLIPKLLNLANLAETDSAFLDTYTENKIPRLTVLVRKPDGFYLYLNRAAFAKEETAIQYRLVRRILSLIPGSDFQPVYPDGKDLNFEITQRITRHVLTGKNGKIAEAGRRVQCKIEYEKAVFYREEEKKAAPELQNPRFEAPEISYLTPSELGDAEIRMPKKKNYEYFDSSEIRKIFCCSESDFLLRNPQSGDRFFPFGASGATTLRKFLIDNKIPVAQRRNLIVLAKGHEILWIPGLRRSDYCKITNHTKKVVQIKIKSEDVYDGECSSNEKYESIR